MCYGFHRTASQLPIDDGDLLPTLQWLNQSRTCTASLFSAVCMPQGLPTSNTSTRSTAPGLFSTLVRAGRPCCRRACVCGRPDHPLYLTHILVGDGEDACNGRSRLDLYSFRNCFLAFQNFSAPDMSLENEVKMLCDLWKQSVVVGSIGQSCTGNGNKELSASGLREHTYPASMACSAAPLCGGSCHWYPLNKWQQMLL